MFESQNSMATAHTEPTPCGYRISRQIFPRSDRRRRWCSRFKNLWLLDGNRRCLL